MIGTAEQPSASIWTRHWGRSTSRAWRENFRNPGTT